MRLYKSDPKFAELDFLLSMRAKLKNPAVYFDLKDLPPELLDKDIEELEMAIEMFFAVNSYHQNAV